MFFEGEGARSFIFCSSNRMRVDGTIKLLGGKHSSMRINNGEKE